MLGSSGLPVTGDRVGMITALTPVILALLGGIGWFIKYKISSTQGPSSPVEITQGQTIPVTALPDYLRGELDESETEARAYRDELIRRGVDPDEVLRKAGVLARAPTGGDE